MDIDIADDIRLVQENRLNAVEKAKSELFAQQLDWSMAPIKRLEPIKEPVRLESGADLGQGVDDSNMMTSVSASSKMDVDISIGTTSSPVRPLQTPHTHVASPAAIDVQVAPLAIKSAVEAIKSKEEANTPVRKVSLRDWMMQKKERVASYDDHDSGDSSGQAVANDSGSVLLSKKVATSNSHTNTDQKLTSNMQNNGGRTVNPNLEKAIPPSLVISGAADKPQKSRESNHHTPLHRNYNETSTYNLQPPPPLRPASAAIETMHVFSRHGSPPLSRPTSAGPLSSRTHTPDPIRREPSREFEHLSTQRTDRDEYSHTHGSNYSDYRKQEPHRSSSARYDRDDAYRSSGDVRARNTYYDKASSRHDAHTHRDYQSRSGEPNTHTPVRYDAPTRDSEVHRSDRSGSDVRRAPRPYERTERRRTEYDDRDRDRHYESSDRRQERSDRVDRYARDESDEHYYSRRENTADSREGAQAGSGSSGNASGSRTVHDKEKSSEPRRDSREFPRDSQGRPRK